MIKFIGLMLLASVMITAAYACDVCGSASGNQSLGILPQHSRHFIGLQYMYSSFESNHPSLFDGKPDEHSQDNYHTVQLWGRFSLGKNWQLFGFVPYRYNKQLSNGISNKTTGLGDISFLVNRVLIREKEEAVWQHQLLAGGGVKLPTGAYTGISAQDKLGIPNMQPGSGSWDFMVNTNYTVRRGKLGLNVDAAYTLTTANKENYKYGNRLNAGLLGFYTFKFNKLAIMPMAGYRYEYALHDYDNYSRKWLNEQSGGYMSFITAGLQSYYGSWGLRLTCQLPASQHYGNGYVSAGSRLDAGILFLL
jgi:hypothetical protein